MLIKVFGSYWKQMQGESLRGQIDRSSAGGIPGPLSLTRIHTIGGEFGSGVSCSEGTALIKTGVCAGQYLEALESRFQRIWLKSCRSAHTFVCSGTSTDTWQACIMR